MRSVVETLQALRALLEKPESWTQKVLARNASGEYCPPRNPGACQWCLDGGLCKVTDCFILPSTEYLQANQAMFEACKMIPFKFNDAEGRTHADILAAIDRGIVIAQERLSNG